MKWLKWFIYACLMLLAVATLVIWILLPPVNIPLTGMLANYFPDYFDKPEADVTVVHQRLRVPEGFVLSLFAPDVADARFLRVTAGGDVLVTAQREGRILLLLQDKNGDGVSDGRRVLLHGLDGPNGMDIRDGYLYVAEEGQVGRVAFDEQQGVLTGPYEVLIRNLPRGGNHWRKTIHFGPDGLLYMTVGSSCNACLGNDERRAAMIRFDANGKYLGIFATGLRNSAGFDWSPIDGKLYATDNGRDLLGDDYPPCELNQIQQGAFYGWPYANGNRDADPEFGAGRETVINASIPPAYEFRAHNAPLGLVFLKSAMVPAHYRGAALVALHGSWNRTEKDGYKVVSLHWGPAGAITAENFLTGFLKDGQVIGRPAEVAEAPDGSIFVSDDYANAVYLIRPDTLASSVSGQKRELDMAAPKLRKSYNGAAVGATERAAALAAGAELYRQGGCRACHVFNASGTAGKVSLAGLPQRFDLPSLDHLLRQPEQPMPPYGGTTKQRRMLSIYLLETL